MRKTNPVLLLLVTLTFLAAAVDAAVPGWSHTSRQTHLDVQGCAVQAAKAIQNFTAQPPTTKKLDNNNYEIRGSKDSEAVFAFCTAATATICKRPVGMLTILTFSSVDRDHATAARDKVYTAFGDQVLLCDPAGP